MVMKMELIENRLCELKFVFFLGHRRVVKLLKTFKSPERYTKEEMIANQEKERLLAEKEHIRQIEYLKKHPIPTDSAEEPYVQEPLVNTNFDVSREEDRVL